MKTIEIARDDIPFLGFAYLHCGFCEWWALSDEKCTKGFKPRLYFCPENNEYFHFRKSCLTSTSLPKYWQEATDTTFETRGAFFTC